MDDKDLNFGTTGEGFDDIIDETAAKPFRGVEQPDPPQEIEPTSQPSVDNRGNLIEANRAQANMQLSANVGFGLGNIIKGISGSQEGADRQFYQNAMTASYAPGKMAEELQQFQARDLAVTEQRLALEERDPTSALNRRFQKNLRPWLEQAGLTDIVDYVTIDGLKPGRLVQWALEARERAQAASEMSLAELERLDLEHRNTMEEIAAKNAGKQRPRGTGGGTSGQLAGATVDYFKDQLGGDEALTDSDRKALSAFAGTKKGTPAAAAIRKDLEARIAARRAGQGEDVVGQRSGRVTRDDIIKEAEKYRSAVGDHPVTLFQANRALKIIDQLTDTEINAVLTGKELPPALMDRIGGAQEASQTLAFMRQAYGKSISGAGMSDRERKDINDGMGLVRLGTKNSVKIGLQLIKRGAQAHLATKQSTMSPEAREYVNMDDKQQRAFMANLGGKTRPVTNSIGGGDKVSVKINGQPASIDRDKLDAVRARAQKLGHRFEVQ